jgi:hypothetical protein
LQVSILIYGKSEIIVEKGLAFDSRASARVASHAEAAHATHRPTDKRTIIWRYNEASNIIW